jgi:proteasome lid subunit RPN8/RPN11
VLARAADILRQQASGVAECPLGLRSDQSALVRDEPRPSCLIPTDLVIASWRALFPAERMMFIAGRRLAHVLCATSVRDVTGALRSPGYVKASSVLLHEALLDWESAGARVLAWIHSHPGSGAQSTHPSGIDRRADRELCAAYGDVVGIIVTSDGWLRVWGEAVETGHRAGFLFQGDGIVSTESPHVYRVAAR